MGGARLWCDADSSEESSVHFLSSEGCEFVEMPRFFRGLERVIPDCVEEERLCEATSGEIGLGDDAGACFL
jgi:hypothetical protein